MNPSPLAVSTLATPSPLENLLALVFTAIAVLFVAMMLVSVAITALAPLVPRLWVQLTTAPRTRREKRKERVINRTLLEMDERESEAIRQRIIALTNISELSQSSNPYSDILAHDLLAQEVAA